MNSTIDEFSLQIDNQKFRKINALWNSLKLNDPWSVGYVTTIIESQNFQSKEEWEAFYYKSGEERVRKILNIKSDQEKKALNDRLYQKQNPKNKLSTYVKSLNLEHGRRKQDLNDRAKELHEECVKKKIDISLEECQECVRYRVICETWNGVVIRERNTVENLKKKFPEYEFKKTSGDFDFKYAVDYEVKKNGELLFGIQVKPKTYRYNIPYVNKARKMNFIKNKLYKEEFNQPVFDILSQRSGEIIEHDIVEKIEYHINKNFVSL